MNSVDAFPRTRVVVTMGVAAAMIHAGRIGKIASRVMQTKEMRAMQ